MGGTIDPAQLDQILNKFKGFLDFNERTSETTNRFQAVGPLHSTYLASLAKPISTPNMSMYDSMPLVEQYKLDEKRDWKNLQPGRRPVFNFRYLNNNDIVQFGEKFFNSLNIHEGTSETVNRVQVVDPIQSTYQTSKEKLLARFDSVPLVYKLDEKSDWKDLNPGRRPVYNFRYLNDNDIVQLGENVFNSHRINVTDSTLANLMLLAYNLKDNKGGRCFGKVPEELRDPSKSREFDAILHLHPSYEESSNERIAKGFCYLAASYMKLYTKSTANYIRIQNHLHQNFINHYGFSFPFASFNLPHESLKSLKSHLDLNSILKNSFYNLLYAGEMTPVGKDLKEFLYVKDIAHTGLLPYVLFCHIMKTLRVTNVNLACIMYSSMFDREFNAIARIFTNFIANDHTDYQYKMWRFGRIFDSNFLSSLKTKDATFFIAICASILHIVSEESYAHIFLIPDIAKMDERKKLQAVGYALRAIQVHEFFDSSRKKNGSGVKQLFI